MVSKHSQEFYDSVFRIGVFRLKNEKEGSFEVLTTTYDTTRYLMLTTTYDTTCYLMLATTYDTTRYLIQYIGLTLTA